MKSGPEYLIPTKLFIDFFFVSFQLCVDFIAASQQFFVILLLHSKPCRQSLGQRSIS